MPWANLDDGFTDHPKIIGLSDSAFRLHVAGILYCARHLTDGLVSAEAVPTLVPRYRRAALAELTGRGLWHDHTEAAVYEIHDFLEWNRSRASVEAERERKAAGGRRGAARRWQKP
jgi:hypothetical protein